MKISIPLPSGDVLEFEGKILAKSLADGEKWVEVPVPKCDFVSVDLVEIKSSPDDVAEFRSAKWLRGDV